MRDSGRDQIPPDVRFAGKPAEMRAPPWISSPHQFLTEIPSCEAGHVAAPDQCCSNVRKFLPWRRPHVTLTGSHVLATDQLTFCTAGIFHEPSRIEGSLSFGQYRRSISWNLPSGAGSQLDSFSVPVNPSGCRDRPSRPDWILDFAWR